MESLRRPSGHANESVTRSKEDGSLHQEVRSVGIDDQLRAVRYALERVAGFDVNKTEAIWIEDRAYADYETGLASDAAFFLVNDRVVLSRARVEMAVADARSHASGEDNPRLREMVFRSTLLWLLQRELRIGSAGIAFRVAI